MFKTPVNPKDISNSVADYFMEEKDITQPFKGELEPFVGTYTGKVFGRELSRSFEAHEKKLVLDMVGEKQTLEYIGDHKWIGEDGYQYAFSTGAETKVQIIAPLMSIPFVKQE